VHRLKRFPELRLTTSTFGTGEPRLKKRQRTTVPDCVAWLDNADLIGALAASARAELDTIGRDLARTPVAAFRACMSVVARERGARLEILRRLYEGIAPSTAVESWLDEHHGFGVLPPGYAMPSHLVRLILNHVHPPPEVYTTWCLDLSAMRLVMTSEVLGLIARELALSSLTVRRTVNHSPPNPGKELESP
jgi:hypothetical protein